MKSYWMMLLLCVGVIVLSGCGGDSGPKTYDVTGTIEQAGGPVEGALVTFIATDKENPSSSGKTDKNGKYTLTTVGGKAGAVPGEFLVTIVKYEASAAAAGSGAVDESGYDAGYSGEEVVAEAKNLLPEKYMRPGSSGLKANVTEDAAKNVFDFTVD